MTINEENTGHIRTKNNFSSVFQLRSLSGLFTSFTQVKVYNLMQHEHGADDVLVMGTDGLWDVLSNQEVAEAVTSFLANCDPDDLHR